MTRFFAEEQVNVKNKNQRKIASETITNQLDKMHYDFNGWKARIKSIKEKYPKKKKE
jgi:hypothetical protein